MLLPLPFERGMVVRAPAAALNWEIANDGTVQASESLQHNFWKT